MKRNVFFLFLMIHSCSFAQDLKLAGIGYTYYPKAEIKNSANPEDKVSYREWNAFITIPAVSKNKRNTFLNKFEYVNMKPITHAVSGTPVISNTFYTISYGLSWIHAFNPKMLLLLAAGPSIVSDLKGGLSGHDFLFQGSALVQKVFNNNWSGGLGIAYLSQLGRPLLVPVFQFGYTKNRLNVSALLPLSAAVTCSSADKKWKYGLSAKLGGNNYNLGDGHLVDGTNVVIDKVRYSRINAGPMLEWKFWRALTLETAIGITSNRILELEDDQKSRYKFDAKPGPYFNIGLSFSVPATTGNKTL